MTRILNVGCNIDSERISEDVVIEDITVEEFRKLQEVRSDIVVWTNNQIFDSGLLANMQGVDLFVNWGGYDKNLPEIEEFETRGIDVRTTIGYCTETVADFGFQQIEERQEILKPGDTIGFIGMGRIGYTLAKKLMQRHKKIEIAYHTPSPKVGFRDFQYLSLSQLQAKSKIIVIVVNHGESLVDMEALSQNPNKPFILNLSREAAFPIATIEGLIESGVIGDCVSDNKTPSDKPDLDKFYTGHRAYKSEQAKAHKHFILQGLINRLRAKKIGEDFSVYVSRHGETEWNKEGRFQGRLNSPLTDKGKRQAKDLATFLKDRGISAIYTSPLGRSVETARIASEILGIEPRAEEKLIEMDFGALQGLPKSSIKNYPDFLQRRSIDKLRTSYPNGESYYDVALRIQRDVDKVIASGRNALFIGHESTNKIIRGFVGQFRLEHAVNLGQKNSQLVEYKFASASEVTHEL